MLYTTHQNAPVNERESIGIDTRGLATPVLSATDAAKTMVRQLIESGELRPGERLNADELGRRLGVSRTPVRDALHHLRTEGLVDIQPRRGVFVRNISSKEVDEVYALKAAVEPVAAEWAAERGSDQAKAGLAALLDGLIDAGRAADVRLAAGHVDRIHDLLFDMAGSSVLKDVYAVFHGRVKWLRHLNMAQPGRLEASVKQHTDIVERVIRGDGPGARAIMAEHMEDASLSVRNVVS